MKCGRVEWQKAEATRKDFNIVLIHQDTKCFYLQALQGHSGRNPIDPSLQDNVVIQSNFFEYYYHIGCAINLHSIINNGLILWRSGFEDTPGVYSFCLLILETKSMRILKRLT